MQLSLLEQIITLRKRKGLTQEQAAAAIGISRQSLHAIETGKVSPRVSQLEQIASALGATLSVQFAA